MQLDGYGVAEGDLGGVAEEDAVGVGGDGVAAFQNFQRAAFLELQGEALPAFSLSAEEAFGADAEFGAAFFEAQAERGNLHAKIEGSDAQVGGGETLARLFEAGAEAEGEARSHFVGALALLAEEIERAAETAASGKFVNAAAQDEDAIAHLFGKSIAENGNVLVKFAARLNDKLGGGGWRRGANVGDKIGDGEIGFMADTGDHGNFGSEDSTGDDFFVERPQIFHGAAATREDQHVDEFPFIKKLERFDDFFSGAFA